MSKSKPTVRIDKAMSPLLAQYLSQVHHTKTGKSETPNVDPRGTKAPSMYSTAPKVLATDTIADRDWASNGFVTPLSKLHPRSRTVAIASGADTSYTDSSLGGNYSLNPRPQFTPFADPRRGLLINQANVLAIADGNTLGINPVPIALNPAIYNKRQPVYTGMGRIYYEKVEAVKQTVRLQFGVPKYQAMAVFWTSFLNPELETLARTGVVPSLLKTVVSAGVKLIVMIALPELAILTWLTKTLSSVLFGRGGGRYYRVEPTPHIYLASLNTMINQYMVYEGLYPTAVNLDKEKGKLPVEAKEQLDLLHAYMPNVYTANYGIDMFAVMGRVEAIRRNTFKELKKLDKTKSSVEAIRLKAAKKNIRITSETLMRNKQPTKHRSLYELISSSDANYIKQKTYDQALEDIKKEFNNKGLKDDAPADGGAAPAAEGDAPAEPAAPSNAEANDIATKQKVEEQVKALANYNADLFQQAKGGAEKNDNVEIKENPAGIKDSYFNWMKVFMDSGTLYTTLDVNATGTVTESFSNSTGPIEFGASFNSASAGSESMRYNLSGGNISDGLIGMAFDAVKAVGSIAIDALSTVDFGLTSGISALIRGAKVDIPNRYQDSSFQLSGTTYTMTLISHSGSPMSRTNNIIIPLFALIAGVAPRATGLNSHTSPLLCKLTDKGRANVPLGIITSLSIKRGDANLGYTIDDKALCIVVDFTVTDLSPIMAIPISEGSLFSGGSKISTMAKDSPWGEYLNTLAATSIADQTFWTRRFAIEKALLYRDWDTFTSSARAGHSMSGWAPLALYSKLTGTHAGDRRG